MSELLDAARERLEMIRDSASSVVPRDAGASRARALRFREPGFDRGLWTQMCELGWGGLRVPEERGGSGFDVAALCAVAQQMGSSLSPEPFVAVAAAAQLLHGDLLKDVMSGKRIVVPAWMEHAHDLGTGDRRTQFRGGKVSGTKRLVAGALAADAFVVSGQGGLALVRRDAPGVSVTAVSLHDGGFAGDVAFADAFGQAWAAPPPHPALSQREREKIKSPHSPDTSRPSLKNRRSPPPPTCWARWKRRSTPRWPT